MNLNKHLIYCRYEMPKPTPSTINNTYTPLSSFLTKLSSNNKFHPSSSSSSSSLSTSLLSSLSKPSLRASSPYLVRFGFPLILMSELPDKYYKRVPPPKRSSLYPDKHYQPHEAAFPFMYSLERVINACPPFCNRLEIFIYMIFIFVFIFLFYLFVYLFISTATTLQTSNTYVQAYSSLHTHILLTHLCTY